MLTLIEVAMGNAPANVSGSGRLELRRGGRQRKRFHGGAHRPWRWAFLAPAILAAALAFAQTSPHVTAVDPASGKVNDSVTVTGQNLGKDTVVGVFLSDNKDDYKATITDQADDKIVMKVPQVKAGDYKVSLQAGDRILIMPVRFTVAP
jgi:hypothetical protein